jgi:hypothetical protein
LFLFVRKDGKTQFRFELSVRRKGAQKQKIFITYKGATGSLDRSIGADQLVTYAPLVDGVSEPSRIAVLNPVSPNSRSTITGDVDTNPPFASGLRGMGLVDLSGYGIRQLGEQSLSELKELVKDFVSGNKKSSEEQEIVPVNGNIMLHRQSLDVFRFFLYLNKPIERGQTVALSFPQLPAHLKSGRYRGTEFEQRHLIEEAFYLLSPDDLKEMKLFLENELLGVTGYDECLKKLSEENKIDEPPAGFKAACEARRRLHWVSLRLCRAINEIADQSEKLYFGYFSLSKIDGTTVMADPAVPETLASRERKEGFRTELRKEVLSAIEFNSICGSRSREAWCPFFQETFKLLVDEIMAYYEIPSGASSSKTLETLNEWLTKALALPVDAEHAKDLVMVYSTEMFERLNGVVPGAVRTEPQEAVFQTGEPFVVCAGESDVSKDAAIVRLLPPQDVTAGSAKINIRWYRQIQWNIAFAVVAAASSILSRPEREEYLNSTTLFVLKENAAKKTGIEDLSDPAIVSVLPVYKSCDDCEVLEPRSCPFFHGIVWPTLSKLGWRIEAGESPQDVTFVAPDARAQNHKRSSQLKARRDHRRLELAREAGNTGLGAISKLSKRVIGAIAPTVIGAIAPTNDPKKNVAKKDNEAPEAPVVPPRKMVNKSASVALDKFLNHIKGNLEGGDSNGSEIAKTITDCVLECFNEIAPLLAAKEPATEDSLSLDNGSDAATLIHLLSILPDVLRQSDLPLQEINDSLQIVQELVAFLCTQHEAVLDKRLQPSPEYYAGGDKKVSSGLSSRLRHLHVLKNGGGNVSDTAGGQGVLSEIILEQDKPQLTDFLKAVLEQAIPCRATEQDVKKKFRRIHVGYPGLVCRHCQGTAVEGRYFFTTIESLTTASTVFEKHVLKCSYMPAEIRSQVVETRLNHPVQRKELPVGSQQAFFNRLWDRLRSSKIEGVASGNYVLEHEKSPAEETKIEITPTEKVAFKEHFPLIDFLRTTEPWKQYKEVRTALNQYYNCLEFGGRVFYTQSQPKYFSSEWLLAKVAPPRKKDARKKTRMMPG